MSQDLSRAIQARLRAGESVRMVVEIDPVQASAHTVLLQQVGGRVERLPFAPGRIKGALQEVLAWLEVRDAEGGR